MSAASVAACLVAALAVVLPCGAVYPPGRYGRSMAWAPLPLYYHRGTRPLYYPDTDYYYPQPQDYYYPLPAYYPDQHRPYFYPSYDEAADTTGDPQEEVQDEGGRGEYGQESWYQDNMEDANSRFLQNLILSQMYDSKQEEEGVPGRWVYGQTVPSSRAKPLSPSDKEDEDVRELKSLVEGPDRRNKLTRKDNVFASQTRAKSNNWDEYRTNLKRSNGASESMHKVKPATPTPPPGADRGQKEVVAPRPAVSRSHEPSVYDTIKKLLHMEDLAQGSTRLQKRSFVASEDSLVGQLGRLKTIS